MLLLDEPVETPKVLNHQEQSHLLPLQQVELLWEETRSLTQIMRTWNEQSIFPEFQQSQFRPSPKCNVRPFIEWGKSVMKEADTYRTDFKILARVYHEFLEKSIEQDKNTPESRVTYQVLKVFAEHAAESGCRSGVEELSPGIPNPLQKVGGERYHNINSLLKNDSISRALPSRWSAWHTPNCLGMSIYMTAALEHLGYRFMHCSVLDSYISEVDELSQLMAQNAIAFLKKVDAPQRKIDRLQTLLDNATDIRIFDWMFHHCELVEYNREESRWMIIDPFLDGTVDLGKRPDLSALKCALDSRKTTLPGLSVPIKLNFGRATRRKRLHSANARARRKFGPLFLKHAELKRTLGGFLTEDEFRQHVSDPAILSTFSKGVKHLQRELQLAEEQNDYFRKELSQLQLAALKHLFEGIPDSEFVDNAVLEVINTTWVNSRNRLKEQAQESGHHTAEVHADHAHALGTFLMHAAFAETDFRVYPYEVLGDSSSQLLWREVGNRIPHTEQRVSVLAALKAASTFIGKELDEDLLHPLVLRECRIQSLR